jgi:hypothetical protein
VIPRIDDFESTTARHPDARALGETMPNISSRQDLLADLKTEFAALGLTAREDGNQGLAGEAQPIRSKWWFGARTVTYRMWCRLSEAERTV